MSAAHRQLRVGPLVVASHNPGKTAEITELLGPFGFDVTSASALNLPEPEETGTTFRANAVLKAEAAAAGAGQIALADDSGLAVDALGGEPGIYSARWAGPGKDFAVAMEKVHEAIAASGARGPDANRAYFVCALCLAWPDGHLETFEGRVSGNLVWPPRGKRGFGYDSMFVADGYDITFGEMDPARKHTISHRAQAFAAMVEACLNLAS